MATFSDWVQQVFDHPVTDPAWYWDLDADTSEPPPSTCVEYLTRLFSDPEPVLAPYSDAQLNQAFWYLVSNSSSNYMFTLLEPPVAWEDRRLAIRSIAVLFERLFKRRCSQHLSHLDEAGAHALNSACYMWWDLFPHSGRPEEAAYSETDAELLAVMGRVLALDSVACQESALHGLGHWQARYSAIVRQAVDSFLAREQGRRPELRQYALCARVGHVL